MGRLGLPELLVILAIIIVIFGANRLPGLGRGIGSAIKNFKDGIEGRQGRRRRTTARRHSTTRVSPIRRVTRSRSRYSSSGIANFRDTPNRSLNVATSMRAAPPADAFNAATSAFNRFSASS